MIKYLLVLTALIFSFHSYSQIDSTKILQQKLATATNDSIRMNTLIDLHNALFKSDPEKSYQYALQILELGKKENSSKDISRGYRAIARCIRKKRGYNTIFKYDSLALKYATIYGDLDLINSQQILFVHDYLDAKQLEDAYEWIQIAKPIVIKLNKPDVTAEWIFSTAYYYSQTNQHEKAIPGFYKAINLFQQSNDDKNIAEVKIFLVQSLEALGKNDSVFNLLHEALDIYAKRNSQERMAFVNELLGDFSYANRNGTAAINSYLKAQQLYAVSNNDVEEGLCLIYLARAYMQKKDYTNAKKYIDTSQSLFNKMNYDIGKIKVQTLLGQFFAETSEPAKAELYFGAASNMLKNKNLPDLTTENEKCENENAILSIAIIKKQKIIIALIVVTAIVLGIGFFLQYKNRQRAERDRTKIELLQNEIHHRVKNNLSIIKRFVEVAEKSGLQSLSLTSLQNRITAIELLHKNLYQTNKSGEISLQYYIEQLAKTIGTAFNEDDKNITINVLAPVIVNIKTAEKIGLIINELITNSFKYGFANKKEGKINITAEEKGNKKFKLSYKENGVGFNKQKIIKGYGSKLIEGIANELDARIEIQTENGINFSMIN